MRSQGRSEPSAHPGHTPTARTTGSPPEPVDPPVGRLDSSGHESREDPRLHPAGLGIADRATAQPRAMGPGGDAVGHADDRLDRAAARAASAQDWKALDDLWLDQLRFVGFDAHPGALSTYADIPEEARRSHPMLTWARAVAIATGEPPQDRIVARTFLRDAVALHADWKHNRDTDAAVLAGTMWLSSQAVQRADGGGAEDAWQTRNAVAALLEDRRQHSDPPSDEAAAVFHAKSALLGLLRADVEIAVTEADRAIMLRPGPTARLSAGIRALALEFHGTPETVDPLPPESLPESDPFDFLGRASTPAHLAAALRAIRELDHRAAITALRPLRAELGEPGWPLRVGIIAAVGAIWADPEETLVQMDAELSRNAVLSAEHRSLMARVLLTRVRSMLLCRMDAPADALVLAQKLAEPASWVPRASAQLWSGDLDGAVATARSGLFIDPSTWNFDRIALTVVKAAAIATGGTFNEGERETAFLRAVNACTKGRSLWAVATLPQFARIALYEYHDQRGCDRCILCDPVTRLRVSRLPGSGSAGVLIRLTARERELLPLLATSEPVPAIAAQLHLAVGTVRKQVATLRGKFGAPSREELIRRARSSGHLG